MSEVMLQQTRVETVIPYFARFLEAFPTVGALAEAPLDTVLSRWSGLGYYRRARLLHRGAQAVVRELGGKLPRTAAMLGEVPGIGPYTAGAIASIAFGEEAPLVDGNVARVLARVFAIDDDVRSPAGTKALWAKAGELVVGEAPGDFNQALMELGATICTPKSPRCGACPTASHCAAFAQGRVAELPKLKARTAPKRWRRIAVVALRGDKILLGRRRDALVFGGLWEPPSYDVPRPARAPGAPIGVALADARDAGLVRHVLSHRRMEVRVHTGKLASTLASAKSPEHERFALYSRAELASVGLSTLARKILGLALGG